MSETPNAAPQVLTKIDTLKIGALELDLAKNGAFCLVLQEGRGPYGEPRYRVLDLDTMDDSALRSFAQDLLQAFGQVVFERAGLKRGRAAAEEAA